VNRHFQVTARRQNKSIFCLHGGDIESILMRYLQVSVFFQIKKALCDSPGQYSGRKKAKISFPKKKQ
jgi:hypothetical protein